MRKILTIVGTRPELIKMSRVIARMDEFSDHILAHTGQNYDYQLNNVFFEDLGIRKPNYFLSIDKTSPARAIADVIHKADELIETVEPDALLLYGDTNSCLSVLPAKRRKVPIFHMEAGNRCFDQRVPEEINRKVVDHLSDINLVLTEHARHNLLQEGLPSQQIIKTGSHMPEVLSFYADQISQSEVLAKLNLLPKQYFLVSAHREENVDNLSTLKNLTNSLKLLSREYGFPVIVSTHPRTRKRLDDLEVSDISSDIRFLPPFGFHDYIALQLNAHCVLSDSGTITEEASLLGFPAVTIRNTHERPEGMDAGTLIMSRIDPELLLNSVRIVTSDRTPSSKISDYQSESVSSQILRIVHSYIDYINSNTWKTGK